jgi:hypothetical protein
MLRPTATSVTPLSDYRLLIEFDNGERGVFDVKPYLEGSWFSELRDESVFRSVFVNGVTVEWEGGQDICPDELYHECEMQRS